MPIKEINNFKVSYLQVLDEEGNCDDSVKGDISEDKIKEMYHMMVLLRTLDEKLFNLQRSGKIGTYAQTRGQEASEIGSGLALQESDWFVPSFRELGVYLCRGVDRGTLVQGWNGDTRAFANPNHSHNMPISIPIGSQCVHAAGIAWASKLKGEKDATIVYFGEGATSEGDFHEALNFAGVYKLPIVFFCQRNGWSISTPTSKETASQTIAQKAIAYGFDGIQIDGNDVLAVYKATNDALKKARNGGGPTLIESVTYRLGDHTTSDDSSKYRLDEEKNEWIKKDPIDRLKKYFQKIGTWNDDYEKWVSETVSKEIEEAVEAGLNVEPPKSSQMFDDVFTQKPWMLKEQEEQLTRELQDGDEQKEISDAHQSQSEQSDSKPDSQSLIGGEK